MQRKPLITAKNIAAAQKPWVWDLGNAALYDLCQEHPGHKKRDEIIAKIWLIGRSYSASIERRRHVYPSDGEFYESIRQQS
ncbi:MAG: hypothetical protein L0Y72_16605 [Gemmataceae bacterium]|nr:hypothetical protein [Gemmataceae bacterium]MCI0740671.1 hypothetical protein [Gemmataceae bacterium]